MSDNNESDMSDEERITKAKAENRIPATANPETWLEKKKEDEAEGRSYEYTVEDEDEAKSLAMRKDHENEIPATVSRERWIEENVRIESDESGDSPKWSINKIPLYE